MEHVMVEDVIIVGAGPCGLSVAAELLKRGIDPLIIEKGCITNSIYHFPTFMQFFSTPELLEIGDVPFMTANEKPTRLEALTYYRTVAERKNMRIRTYEKVLEVKKQDANFQLTTENRFGETNSLLAKHVVMATGYFDQPNMLHIPGEDLPKVSHYFKDAHPYHGMKVAVIGGKNSAVEAAMELERHGAEVTVIYRGDHLSDRVKSWVRPVFQSLLEKGRVRMLWKSHVEEIKPRSIIVDHQGDTMEIENDVVFALTGYHPHRELLLSIGVDVDSETNVPTYDPDTMETNVANLYIAGVIAAGNDANVIFIENGRLHGDPIARSIAAKLAAERRDAR